MAIPNSAIAPAIQKISAGAERQNIAKRNKMNAPPTAPHQASVRSGSPSIIGPGSGGTNTSSGSSSSSWLKVRWSSLNKSDSERSELAGARQELAARGSGSAAEASVSGEVRSEERRVGKGGRGREGAQRERKSHSATRGTNR